VSELMVLIVPFINIHVCQMALHSIINVLDGHIHYPVRIR